MSVALGVTAELVSTSLPGEEIPHAARDAAWWGAVSAGRQASGHVHEGLCRLA